MKMFIMTRATGEIICQVPTLQRGLILIHLYENEDREDGNFVEANYDVVDEDLNPIDKALVGRIIAENINNIGRVYLGTDVDIESLISTTGERLAVEVTFRNGKTEYYKTADAAVMALRQKGFIP